MNKPRVALIGGDNTNWALDSDLRLTRRAIEDMATFSNLSDCDVVHSVSWLEIANMPAELLAGKRVICHIPGEPFRYLTIPGASKALERVGQWIGQSTQAQKEMENLGISSKLIPYTIEPDKFYPIKEGAPELQTLRVRWNIPSDSYIISNFHRDTESSDLKSPKLVKGPDVFVEIVKMLAKRKNNIHILLAGPRRLWIRRQLDELRIPYTFIGRPSTDGEDDIAINILSQKELNLLYNLSDLYLISSRSEGGPRSILESAASKCKVISTLVGLAGDILEPDCIYQSPHQAVAIIEKDIQDNHLAQTLEVQFQRILQNHLPKIAAASFQNLYSRIEQIPPFEKDQHQNTQPKTKRDIRTDYARTLKRSSYVLRAGPIGQFWRKYLKPIFGSGTQRLLALQNFLLKQPDTLTISLWHKFVKPPYGGGNQFMLALRKALRKKGAHIVENQLHAGVNVYLLNSIHFDVDAFLRFKAKRKLGIVHRIDGPIHLIRGFDKEKDELTYSLNAEFASATVIQSFWTYQRIIELGYQPVNPTVIHNGVDSEIFHREGRIPFSRDRKIRLISSSWSDNPRKGGPIYKWIEQNLDWDRFEYTFVGRASEDFERIRQIPPVPSEELADILRQHDIYITASKNDPCSNALIEALACGLPALYLNDGGHPELVGFGGLPFDDKEEILPQLDDLVENYEMFQNLIVVSSMDEVAEKYLALFKQVAL